MASPRLPAPPSDFLQTNLLSPDETSFSRRSLSAHPRRWFSSHFRVFSLFLRKLGIFISCLLSSRTQNRLVLGRRRIDGAHLAATIMSPTFLADLECRGLWYALENLSGMSSSSRFKDLPSSSTSRETTVVLRN